MKYKLFPLYPIYLIWAKIEFLSITLLGDFFPVISPPIKATVSSEALSQ
jgi:hypothetical protein